jgi:hypothetical protein
LLAECKDLYEYLDRYGRDLGRKAVSSLDPLHVPGRDKAVDKTVFLRPPNDPQAHTIAAVVKALNVRSAHLARIFSEFPPVG